MSVIAKALEYGARLCNTLRVMEEAAGLVNDITTTPAAGYETDHKVDIALKVLTLGCALNGQNPACRKTEFVARLTQLLSSDLSWRIPTILQEPASDEERAAKLARISVTHLIATVRTACRMRGPGSSGEAIGNCLTPIEDTLRSPDLMKLLRQGIRTRSVQVAARAAGPAFQPRGAGIANADYDGIDLANSNTIPEELYLDPFFAEHECPISSTPIRFPVRIRNDAYEPYERAKLEEWFRTCENTNAPLTSPMTRRVVRREDVYEDTDLRRQIEDRLRLYESRVRRHLSEEAGATDLTRQERGSHRQSAE